MSEKIKAVCHCGAVTHWALGENADHDRIALNIRMAPLDVIDSLTIRRFDGVHSWGFLD